MIDYVGGEVLKLMPAREVIVGKATVLKVFTMGGSKKGVVAGSNVTSGP